MGQQPKLVTPRLPFLRKTGANTERNTAIEIYNGYWTRRINYTEDEWEEGTRAVSYTHLRAHETGAYL
eukprot:5890692-Pyramimonas_sp.AAC.1